MEKNIRILELYSGIGGMHYAAESSGLKSEVVLSVDINTSANEVYRFNFPKTNQKARNIESLTSKELNALKPDVLMMSPPCQPFTRVGLKLDVNDPRCSSFLHLVDIISQLATINHILMENVVGFETSEMRDIFIKALKENSFHFREFLLSPESLNIPNSRTRYFLLARKEQFSFGSENVILKEYPDTISPQSTRMETKLQSYLEDLNDNDLTGHLLSEQTLSKYVKVLDVRQETSTSSCCFTKAYTHYAEGTGSVLQHNNTESIDIQFTKYINSGEDVCHLRGLQLRYFTPREVANLMGFPVNFSFPTSTTNKTKYRLLGNSLNVKVVAVLYKMLMAK